MMNMEICEINELCEDQSSRRLLAKANDISDHSYLSPIALPSKYLNWEKVFDLAWKRRMAGKLLKSSILSNACSISSFLNTQAREVRRTTVLSVRRDPLKLKWTSARWVA